MKFVTNLRQWAVVMPMMLATLMMSGCQVSQAKINTVVTDIANWAPIITSDAVALGTDIASFDTADAAKIQGFLTTLQTDSTSLATLCKQYLAAPSSTLLTQIASTVSTLATTDSSALLAVLQIKNADSQNIAKGVLTTIATALTILSGYLATVNVTVSPAASQALLQMHKDIDWMTVQNELTLAKNQGLVPQYVTMQQAFGM